MPGPPPRDREETRATLERWLAERMDAPGAEVTHVEVPEASGYSHETILFDARWDGGGGGPGGRPGMTASLVARVEPTGFSVFLSPDVRSEYEVMRVVAAHTRAPVPRLRAFEDEPRWLGAPFFVMDAVEGLVPADNPPYALWGWLLDSAPQEQSRVWWSGLEAMAAVHRAPFDALGFLPRGLDDQLDYWTRYAGWAAEGAVPPVVEAALEWVRDNRPPEAAPALCWGDSRLGNQMFEDFRCVAVMDWEMAAVADPELDLGWWVYFDRVFSEGIGAPRLPGFPGREETVARYEELTGRAVRHLAFYEVFAGLRFSAIMMRLFRLMEMFGQLLEGAGAWSDNFATQFLSRQLEEARVPR